MEQFEYDEVMIKAYTDTMYLEKLQEFAQTSGGSRFGYTFHNKGTYYFIELEHGYSASDDYYDHDVIENFDEKIYEDVKWEIRDERFDNEEDFHDYMDSQFIDKYNISQYLVEVVEDEDSIV